MKAFFYTTKTADCTNHVKAWESVYGPCEHRRYEHRRMRTDYSVVQAAQAYLPDAIFYIGAYKAPGNPTYSTFRSFREIAPTFNLCSDAADEPWHTPLDMYRKRECFDLQVAIDGGKNSPADHSTLTPVDARPFEGEAKKDIRCGFSGSVGRWNARSEVMHALQWFGGLTIRDRCHGDNYQDHVDFLKRCQILINASFTGSGHAHHIKGRVLEAGWAKCALLESKGSPIGEWFPDDCYFLYDGPVEAAEFIKGLKDAQIEHAAARLAEEVRAKYTASHIFEGMMQHVDFAQPRSAA